MRDPLIVEAEKKMEVAVENLVHEFSTIRAGRASPALLERVTVNYYGVPTPLNKIANIVAPESRLLVVYPYDPNSLKDIEKAILASDLGLNPSNDGTVIRISIPQLTEERRIQLSKLVRQLAEEARVAVRNVRRDQVEKFRKMEKNKEITEDDLRSLMDEIQKSTDNFIQKIDDLLKAKEKEIFEV